MTKGLNATTEQKSRATFSDSVLSDLNLALGSPSKIAGVHVEFVVKSAYDKEYVAAHHKRREHVKRFLRQCHFKQERVPKA